MSRALPYKIDFEEVNDVKRTVFRPAPRHFEVVGLPPTKFGKSHHFGLQVYPVGDNTRASAISGSFSSVYEIWRTWEDCLWFQELLEDRYVRMSIEKRQRLRAGKGVKKNGMYLQDRAASFESLPPGPDPKSVAKDIHQYFPKLSKRGTFFSANQATVDQRQNEFSAFIKAYFQKRAPSLIEELREEREIRDFFGYWRRDHNLAVKRSNPRPNSRPKTAPGDGISTRSFISSFFSTSTVTLSHSRDGSPPISPRSASLRQHPHTTDSTLSLPDTGSVFFSAASIPPSSAPARLESTFRGSCATSEDEQTISSSSSSSYGPSSTSPRSESSRNRATSLRRAQSHSHRTKASSSPQSDTFNVTSDFPLFLSTSTRDLIPASRRPHSPSYVTSGLETLQEDAMLNPSVSNLPTPTLPRRRHSPPERANRNFVWPEADEVSSSEGDAFERELLTPVDSADFGVAVATPTSNFSPPHSIASDLASRNHGPSWHTSSEHEWPSSTGSNDSCIEIDLPHMTCRDSQLEDSISPSTASSSSLTLNRYRRRRSLSQPLPLGLPVPTDVGEGDWSDQDFIEAFVGSPPEPFFAPTPNDNSIIYYEDVPSDLPLDVSGDPDRLSIVTDFSTPRQESPRIGAPPHASRRPRATAPSRAKPVLRGAAPDDTLFVKAALDDAMVAFRARRDVPFAELRERVIGKFLRSEGTTLRGEFELSFLPPVGGGVGGWGKFRGSTLSLASAVSMSSVADWSGAVPLRSEEDWAAAVADCGSKITVRVTFPGTQ